MPPETMSALPNAPTTALLSVHRRATFVGSSVKELDNTIAIVDAIMPYFPLSCHVISGYLDSEDLYWKVSYHWDLLTSMLEKFSARAETTGDDGVTAASLVKVLETVPPIPPRGYALDKGLGIPADHSSHQQTLERHGVLAKVKLEARELFIRGGVVTPSLEKDPPKFEKRYWLSIARVANPKFGKHRTGFALDIAGANSETTRVARALGASLVFNESSHVHVEFDPKKMKGQLLSRASVPDGLRCGERPRRA